jgi:hypothetical protein
MGGNSFTNGSGDRPSILYRSPQILLLGSGWEEKRNRGEKESGETERRKRAGVCFRYRHPFSKGNVPWTVVSRQWTLSSPSVILSASEESGDCDVGSGIVVLSGETGREQVFGIHI